MRKKTSQVSTLHVIHHGVMPMSGKFIWPLTIYEKHFNINRLDLFSLVWFGVKFTPGGHSTFFGLLNTAVHIVMYTYYLFAAMGPQYQKYLWWKKYLTGLQMVRLQIRSKKYFMFSNNRHFLDSICCHHVTCLPTFVCRLQLPKSLRLVDRNARCYVLLPVQRILQLILWWKEGKISDCIMGTFLSIIMIKTEHFNLITHFYPLFSISFRDHLSISLFAFCRERIIRMKAVQWSQRKRMTTLTRMFPLKV